MKHCPACNFSFPDFHHVCDFDGTDLVLDPERPSLVKAFPRPSRFRRGLKSPELWAGFLLIAVVSSAFLLAYYDATSRSTSVMKARPTPASTASATPATRASNHSAQVKTPVPSTRGTTINSNRLARSSASLRQKATARRSLTRLHQKPVSEPRAARGPRAGIPRGVVVSTGSPKSQIAGRKDARAGDRPPPQISDKKEPKLTAILKTTWNVLKRPFKF